MIRMETGVRGEGIYYHQKQLSRRRGWECCLSRTPGHCNFSPSVNQPEPRTVYWLALCRVPESVVRWCMCYCDELAAWQGCRNHCLAVANVRRSIEIERGASTEEKATSKARSSTSLWLAEWAERLLTSSVWQTETLSEQDLIHGEFV